MTQRTTYSLLDYFGDIGGLVEFLFFVLRYVFMYLGQLKIKALLTSRLFHLHDDDGWIQTKINTLYEGFPDAQRKSSMLFFENERKRTRINVPLFLDWLHLSVLVQQCFCRKRARVTGYKSYRLFSEISGESVSRDLDLIRMIRAKRMHGFGLGLLMDETVLKNSSALAYTRPIR